MDTVAPELQVEGMARFRLLPVVPGAVTLSPALSPYPSWPLELRKYRFVALGKLAKGSGAKQEDGVRSEWSKSLAGLRKTCPSLTSVSSSVTDMEPLKRSPEGLSGCEMALGSEGGLFCLQVLVFQASL